MWILGAKREWSVIFFFVRQAARFLLGIVSMKSLFTIMALGLLSISSAFATFSERKLESAKKSAAQSGKAIAFVFWQEYWDPRCPKCVAQVNANNSALKKAIPRSSVVVVEIEPGEKGLETLPSTVPAKGQNPRIVVVDSTAEKVLAQLSGAPDRKKADEFETTVKEAVGKE
jgi:hypothetical protein